MADRPAGWTDQWQIQGRLNIPVGFHRCGDNQSTNQRALWSSPSYRRTRYIKGVSSPGILRSIFRKLIMINLDISHLWQAMTFRIRLWRVIILTNLVTRLVMKKTAIQRLHHEVQTCVAVNDITTHYDRNAFCLRELFVLWVFSLPLSSLETL